MQTSIGSLRTALRLAVLSAPPVDRLLTHIARALRGSGGKAVPDLVFVTPPRTAQGWILDAICKEIGARLPDADIRYCPFGTPLPPARRYFFSHYMYYVGSLSATNPIRRGKSYVFATHLEPAKHGVSNKLLARVLQTCERVICMNEGLRSDLAALGVSPSKLGVAVGAADSRDYRPHERRPDGKVGFCSAYYARKAPDLLLEIVRGLPSREFVLLGKGWQAYPRFAELLALPNFQYVEAPYAEYASHYSRMSVFVSASQLEGGPIPLLEAMMSNAVPVASRTGFAPDVIEHGRNGFLFDMNASAHEVCEFIERAFLLQCNVHATVSHCDWAPYAARMAGLMGLRDAIAPSLIQVAH
jgi:glycosyltransferase involved in cell wall biosynthesis